jgi:hypothetical protein
MFRPDSRGSKEYLMRYTVTRPQIGNGRRGSEGIIGLNVQETTHDLRTG